MRALDAVFVANMCHISPFSATRGLIAGSARALCVGGVLAVYGPFTVGGEFTTESNAEFDKSLRARDEAWGYRDVDELARLDAECSMALEKRMSTSRDAERDAEAIGESSVLCTTARPCPSSSDKLVTA